tara:strand:- start:149 stop:892 length:744 start_codon:yes stop_codon:yes gene_type:complete
VESPADEQVKAGEIARNAIDFAKQLCSCGLEGLELDTQVEQFIRDSGGKPALKGYHPSFSKKPYEWTICLAVDEDVVHGVPFKMVAPHSIITVDLVVEYNGWFADTARTFTFSTDNSKRQFVKNSLSIFNAATDMIMPQQLIDLYGMTVEEGAEMFGYSVVDEYCGHGIGKEIHALPQVCNTRTHNHEVFQVGKSFAVEPVLAINSAYSLRHEPDDGFSVKADCLVSHNEDTIFIGRNGVVNLTGNQ